MQVQPLILPISILQVQILTQALIQTKTHDHEVVTPVSIGLHVIWDQLQGGGSPFSKPPPLPPLSTALCMKPPPPPPLRIPKTTGLPGVQDLRPLVLQIFNNKWVAAIVSL